MPQRRRRPPSPRARGSSATQGREGIATPSEPLGGGQAEIEAAVKSWQDTYQREGIETLEGRNAHVRAAELAPILRDSKLQNVSHVLRKIERLSPEVLLRRSLAVRTLRGSPYYSLHELKDRVASTLAALARNKVSLVETGNATGSLEACEWLSQWVSTYPEITSLAQGSRGDETTDGLPFTKMKPENLQRVREKLVDLKILIFREFKSALDAGSGRDLWARCLARLKDAYSANRFRQLEALDRKFAQKVYPWDPSGSYQGTLPDLLFLIGFFETEITTRLFERTKEALERASFDPIKREYLEVLGGNHDSVDTALDAYSKDLNRQAEEFWPEFRDRVDRAVEEEFDHKVTFRFRVPGRYAEDSRILMASTARVHREALVARGAFADGESLVPLTPKELEESARRGYRYLGLVVIRTVPGSTSDVEVSLHGKPMRVTLELFASFLRLVKEAFKEPDKFLSTKRLGAVNPHQRIEEIRKALGQDRFGLIETRPRKGYRLSVHPSLIRYDKAALLRHESAAVRELARDLPEREDV